MAALDIAPNRSVARFMQFNCTRIYSKNFPKEVIDKKRLKSGFRHVYDDNLEAP